MDLNCPYCHADGEFESLRNPEDGKSRPTCQECRAQLQARRRKARLAARVRFYGVPLLTLAAVIWLLFGNWQASVLSSMLAGMIAGMDPSAV
jgi:hypothetical protein